MCVCLLGAAGAAAQRGAACAALPCALLPAPAPAPAPTHALRQHTLRHAHPCCPSHALRRPSCPQAPGYFGAIAQPMDLSTARAKVEAGQYSSWAGLVADLRLMFSNALTYNPRDSVVWQYSATLAAQAGRIMQAAA